MNLNQGKIIIRDTLSQATLAASDLFLKKAKECVSDKGFFTVAISGGSAPRPMHRMLAEEPYRSKIPWNRTHIFWVDERCVSFADPASNYGAAKQDILDMVGIPQEQIYPMFDGGFPEEKALKYQKKIVDFFQLKEGQYPMFDLIFLGVGQDGHTASLFPGQEAVSENNKIIIAVRGGNPNVDRISMTFSALNSAAYVVFLASGNEKAAIVNNILSGSKPGLPASKIKPKNGILIWILDKEAASLM